MRNTSVSRLVDVMVGDWGFVDLVLHPPKLQERLSFIPAAFFISPTLLAEDSLIGRRRFLALCSPSLLDEERPCALLLVSLLDGVSAFCTGGPPVFLARDLRTLGSRLGCASPVDDAAFVLGSIDASFFA